jgi:ketopantoate reductase
MSEHLPEPEMILVAVGESDLSPVLEQIPQHWKDRLCLLQNELLPRDWQAHNIQNPTVISVWFEKKKGMDFKVLVPSPVIGPKAEIITHALSTLDIPAWIVKDDQEMLFELVRKNLYILTTNIAGLDMPPGSDVNDLWNDNRELALRVIDNVLTIQSHLTGQNFDDADRERLIEAMVEAINGDLAHKCMGRSAPARLARALEYAREHDLEVKELERIAARA